MRAVLPLILSVLAGAAASLVPRQSGAASPDYINSVCSPNVTSSSGTLPPCISITNIETQCAPNGTQPIDYLAHAQCLCSAPSSFFSDWQGCRRCLFVHGALSQQNLDTNSMIISSASNALCTGTPTASFAAIFSSVAAGVPQVTTGASVSSDQYPSQSAVSLYYTAAGQQGPGAITGSATAATRAVTASGVMSSTQTSSTAARSGSTSGSGSSSTTRASSASAGATSSSGAQPTHAIDSVAVVLAAGALLAAL